MGCTPHPFPTQQFLSGEPAGTWALEVTLVTIWGAHLQKAVVVPQQVHVCFPGSCACVT